MNKALRRQKSKPQRDLGGDCFRSLISSSISYKIHTENVYWEMASKGDIYTKELFLRASGLEPIMGSRGGRSARKDQKSQIRSETDLSRDQMLESKQTKPTQDLKTPVPKRVLSSSALSRCNKGIRTKRSLARKRFIWFTHPK